MKNFSPLLLVPFFIFTFGHAQEKGEFAGNWISTYVSVQQFGAYAGMQGKMNAVARFRAPIMLPPYTSSLPFGYNIITAVAADAHFLKRRLNTGFYANYSNYEGAYLVTSSVGGTANYGFNFAENHRLNIGLGAEYNYQLALDHDNTGRYHDQILWTRHALQYQVGAWYRWKNLQIGVSVWNLGLPPFKHYEKNNDIRYTSKSDTPLYFWGSFTIPLTKWLSITPFLNLTFILNDLNKYDGVLGKFGAQFQITKYAMFGVGYESKDKLLLQLGGKLGRFRLHYSPKVEFSYWSNGVSHEIGFRYLVD